LLSFKDNIFYKARYWSSGILGEEVSIHIKFPSTLFKDVSNLLHAYSQNRIRQPFTEQAPNGCRPDCPPQPGGGCPQNRTPPTSHHTHVHGAAFLCGTFLAGRGLQFPELSVAFQKHYIHACIFVHIHQHLLICNLSWELLLFLYSCKTSI